MLVDLAQDIPGSILARSAVTIIKKFLIMIKLSSSHVVQDWHGSWQGIPLVIVIRE